MHSLIRKLFCTADWSCVLQVSLFGWCVSAMESCEQMAKCNPCTFNVVHCCAAWSVQITSAFSASAWTLAHNRSVRRSVVSAKSFDFYKFTTNFQFNQIAGHLAALREALHPNIFEFYFWIFWHFFFFPMHNAHCTCYTLCGEENSFGVLKSLDFSVHIAKCALGLIRQSRVISTGKPVARPPAASEAFR